MTKVKVGGIDVSHQRLVELAKLADQAKPFYEWVEKSFQQALRRKGSLTEIISGADGAGLELALGSCFAPKSIIGLPVMFDGIGRTYQHRKACFYFFSWILRDAPQQRLAPIVTRIAKEKKISTETAELEILVSLFMAYREVVLNFSWEAVREVIIDRLEGSRRSIKGHERETVVRSAFAAAIQQYFSKNKNFGKYARAELSKGQVKIGNETYDVCVELLNEAGKTIRRILAPVKTRETEGGGHAHLFTRDIRHAIQLVRQHAPKDFVVAVIVAKNWSKREAEGVADIVDLALIFDLSPNEFDTFDKTHQASLNRFIELVFAGTTTPKN